LRINYALFGNVEPALHAHVFPRRADERPDIRTAQPWALDWQIAPQFSPELHGELQRRIASHLAVKSVKVLTPTPRPQRP
jgi:diadenosine tetraphosphate (Ap4A) HIT family hydrolase